jgi:hypothetical protein
LAWTIPSAAEWPSGGRAAWYSRRGSAGGIEQERMSDQMSIVGAGGLVY